MKVSVKPDVLADQSFVKLVAAVREALNDPVALIRMKLAGWDYAELYYYCQPWQRMYLDQIYKHKGI